MRRHNLAKPPCSALTLFFRRCAPRLFIPGVLILAALACNIPQATNQPDSTNQPFSIETADLEQALAVTPRDDRQEVLDSMGRPDAFRITFEILETQTVRYEEWSYFDDRTCLAFVDGTLVYTMEIEAVPDGTIFASDYDPLGFDALTSVEEAETLLADQEFIEQDTAQTGEPGGLLVASRQILLGFSNGALVYVETLVLTPEEAAQ